MANDQKTKSFEVTPGVRPDRAPAIRNSNERGDRLTQGEAGGTMSGNRDADLRAHGEAGSSGGGLPPMPDNDARIHSRDDGGTSGSESGGGSGATGSSSGTGPSENRGADDDR